MLDPDNKRLILQYLKEANSLIIGDTIYNLHQFHTILDKINLLLTSLSQKDRDAVISEFFESISQERLN